MSSKQQDLNGEIVENFRKKSPRSARYGDDIKHEYEYDSEIVNVFLTPPRLFLALNTEFHFQLDAATEPYNPLRTPHFYTREDNGLTKNWLDPTYCNPPYAPYAVIEGFVKKARYEQTFRGITVVMLLPANTDRGWFHKYVYGCSGVEIRFLKGRLQFFKAGTMEKYSASFPSMVVIFRGAKIAAGGDLDKFRQDGKEN